MATAKETLKGVLPRPARSSDEFQTQLVNTLEAHLEARIAEARDAASRAGDDAVFAGQVVLEALGGIERTVARLAGAVADLEVGPTASERLRRRVLPALAARAVHGVGEHASVLDLSPDGGEVAATLAVLGHRVTRLGPAGPLGELAGVGPLIAGDAVDVVLVAGVTVEQIVLALLRSSSLVPPSAALVLLSGPPAEGEPDPLTDGGTSTPDEVRAALDRRPAAVSTHRLGDSSIRSIVLGPALQ